MNAARSLPDPRLACGRPFRLRDRECDPFVAPAAGVRNSLPASQEFSTRSALFAAGSTPAKSTRRLIGITIGRIGRIGADRRAKFPITQPLPAV
jgi:hypothetical protein